MIPKIIHYCWFGHKSLPELAMRCIRSWEKYCPDYEIKLWNESNFDIYSCPYIIEAYEEKRWAFVSDYARLKIVYENGGIYLDTDVEVLRSFDDFLTQPCFFGTEVSKNGSGLVATGLGFGAEKGNTVVKALMDEYEGIHFRGNNGIYDATPCPERNTKPLVKMGFRFSEKDVWKSENVVVYPPEYFCPMDYITREKKITDNSYSIHLYSASWITDKDREVMTKIEELERSNGKVIGQIKKQYMLYMMLKKDGKSENFIGFIWNKFILKLGNKK